MSASNGARIVHRSPGRLRVRVTDLRDDAERARKIVDRLSTLHGVSRIETKAETGSVLVLFDGEQFDEERFIETARESELFYVAPDAPAEGPADAAPATPQPHGHTVYAAWGGANRVVTRATWGLFDLGTLIPLAMVIWAIRQIAVEQTLARTPWYTLLWYAFGVFTKFHPGPKS